MPLRRRPTLLLWEHVVCRYQACFPCIHAHRWQPDEGGAWCAACSAVAERCALRRGAVHRSCLSFHHLCQHTGRASKGRREHGTLSAQHRHHTAGPTGQPAAQAAGWAAHRQAGLAAGSSQEPEGSPCLLTPVRPPCCLARSALPAAGPLRSPADAAARGQALRVAAEGKRGCGCGSPPAGEGGRPGEAGRHRHKVCHLATNTM